MPVKLAPSEVSRESVHVVLRDSTSISPDCSAVKRSFADSGTNLTLLGSLKMTAAIARQTSTSIPVQLPLSSGAEKPGRPWLTPQDNMPRSVTVLSVCALAMCVERPVARARVKTRDTRFMAKPFKGRPGTFACRRARRWAGLENPFAAAGAKSEKAVWRAVQSNDGYWSRQAPQRADRK